MMVEFVYAAADLRPKRDLKMPIALLKNDNDNMYVKDIIKKYLFLK